jgi:hypothetical protein
MKSKLQEKLLKKYPEFFQDELPIYTGGVKDVGKLLAQKEMVLPIQFGFECGDGWYMLLDELMSEIQNHIDNENHNRSIEFKYKWMGNLQRWMRVKKAKTANSKWQKMVEWIYEKAPKGGRPPISIKISQIKEKFGGLRFYYYGGDKYIDGLTSFAESLSYKICEQCGTTINVGSTQGWMCVVCEDCYKKHDRMQNLIWKPRKDN